MDSWLKKTLTLNWNSGRSKDTLKDVNSRTGGDLFGISEDVACSTGKQKLKLKLTF